MLFIPWPSPRPAWGRERASPMCPTGAGEGGSVPATPTKLGPKRWTHVIMPQEMDPFWGAPRHGPFFGFPKRWTHFEAPQEMDPFWDAPGDGPTLGFPKPIILVQNRSGS